MRENAVTYIIITWIICMTVIMSVQMFTDSHCIQTPNDVNITNNIIQNGSCVFINNDSDYNQEKYDKLYKKVSIIDDKFVI
jgi:hypothetical protein